MNPAIIIPTYHCPTLRETKGSAHDIYDHATPINAPGELKRCLTSLQKVEGLGQVILLVAADAEVAEEAANKVQRIADEFPQMHILVIGDAECKIIQQRLVQHGFGDVSKEIGLRGYGAVRNLGLVVANAFGFDSVVFVDDDEVIDDPEFLRRAMYGLGKLTKKGIPILAKTGYYLNDEGNYHSKSQSRWYNYFWQQGRAFNHWIDRAMAGPRLSRSNHVCGGMLALHREVYKRLSFDAWIHRGEDLDYLLNLRMYGSDVWFDNRWVCRHLPPKNRHEGHRFRKDIYRWIYEYAKVEFSRSQIDLLQIKPSSLEPYPGPFLEPGIAKRVKRTALLRSLVRSDKKEYRRAAREASTLAQAYAEQNCSRYFDFQRVWPEIMLATESDDALVQALAQAAFARQAGETVVVAPIEAPEQEPAENVAVAADAAVESYDAAASSAAAPQADAEPKRYHVPSIASLDIPNINVDPGLTGEIRLNLGEDE